MQDTEIGIVDEEWDGISFEELAPEESAVSVETETAADQPEESFFEADTDERHVEPVEEPTEPEENKPADQRFVLKHLDETIEGDWNNEENRQMLITNAQKGMDYDRVKGQLAEARNDQDRLSFLNEFLEELAKPANMTVDELIDTTRARILKDAEEQAGREITESEALLRVQRNKATKATAKPDVEKEENPEQKRNDMILAFCTAYPDVKADTIPQEVWNESFKTNDLVGAYSRYENKKLKERIAILENNKKNSERSTGSMKGAGAKSSDLFDALWNDGN